MVQSDKFSILCPACKHQNVYCIDRLGIYTIYRCRFCSLEFCDPMKGMSPQEYEISEQYNESRRIASTNPKSLIFWGHKQFFKKIPKYPNCDYATKLLDIGCGAGLFVEMALKKGYDAYGVDFDRASIQVAQRSEKLKKRVFLGNNQEVFKRFGPSSFGIITFFEVLEHIENPSLFLSQVWEILVPDGIIALVIPQADRRSLRYLPREAADRPPQHLTRWTSKALRIIIKTSGFDIFKLIENPVSFGFYRFLSSKKISGSESSITNLQPIKRFFDFAVGCKQTLLSPVFSAMGLRGDRILLIARKKERQYSDG